MHGSDEGFKPKHDKTKNGTCHGVRLAIWVTSDFSKISLRLSGALEFWRVCRHEGPELMGGLTKRDVLVVVNLVVKCATL